VVHWNRKEADMTTKELIYAEIEQVDDDLLDELYAIIKQFTQSKQAAKPSLMEKLKRIQIDAPEDFAANLDLYLSGEKRAESDLH
jgi:hypothetical protein